MRGGTTAELKSRLPLKGLADQLDLYVCEVLYGEHTKGWNSRRRMLVRIQPQIPDLGMGSVYTIARLTDVIGWLVPAQWDRVCPLSKWNDLSVQE